MIDVDKLKKEKFLSMGVLVLILITIWYMLDFVLLTFVITFLFYNLLKLIKKHNRKSMIGDNAPDKAIIVFLYALVTAIVMIATVNLFPKITYQTTELLKIIENADVEALMNSLPEKARPVVDKIDIDKYIMTGGKMVAETITKVGGFAFNLALAFVLSFLLLMEKNKIYNFALRLKESRIGSVYVYIRNFGVNFTVTFGKVISVQALISTINAFISTVMLYFMGFPQVLALGFMIWILGFVPVAGVLISLIPLSVIAYAIGGFVKVGLVWIMIAAIHALETYALNPKLMSRKTDLPVCFVFIILLVSEHYMGIWGLLIGVPLFIFLMDVLEVNFQESHDSKISGKKKIEKERY